ncbi:hypothetical protein Tco_0595592 [Tanacetum coccineum]
MEPQLDLYVRLGEMLGQRYLTIGIRARLGPVVVWMVFPRLDPGSTVLVDPGKPCTERKPVKKAGCFDGKCQRYEKGGIMAIVEGEAHGGLGLRGGLLGVQTQSHFGRIIISKLTYKLGGLLFPLPIGFGMEPQLGLYVRLEDPKTSHLEAVKRIFRYIKGTMHLGLWYPKGFDIETIVYADSDHARDYVDCKSTSGVCTFMGCCLTSWFSKKQPAFAISTTEAEYVSAGKACQQALWIKQALIDYDIRLDNIPIMCDNKGAIDLSKNPVQHSRTKHIEIRHHFLRDNVQKGNISLEKVSSKDNIADILTKPLKREPFNYLRLGLGMMEQID